MSNYYRKPYQLARVLSFVFEEYYDSGCDFPAVKFEETQLQSLYGCSPLTREDLLKTNAILLNSSLTLVNKGDLEEYSWILTRCVIEEVYEIRTELLDMFLPKFTNANAEGEDDEYYEGDEDDEDDEFYLVDPLVKNVMKM